MTGCPHSPSPFSFPPAYASLLGEKSQNWNWNFIARHFVFVASLPLPFRGGHRNMKSMPKIEIQKTENRNQKNRKKNSKGGLLNQNRVHTHTHKFLSAIFGCFLSVLCPKAKMESRPEIELKHGTEIPWLTRHNYIFMDKFLCLCNTLTMLTTTMMMLLLLITTTSMMAWFAASKTSIKRLRTRNTNGSCKTSGHTRKMLENFNKVSLRYERIEVEGLGEIKLWKETYYNLNWIGT